MYYRLFYVSALILQIVYSRHLLGNGSDVSSIQPKHTPSWPNLRVFNSTGRHLQDEIATPTIEPAPVPDVVPIPTPTPVPDVEPILTPTPVPDVEPIPTPPATVCPPCICSVTPIDLTVHDDFCETVTQDMSTVAHVSIGTFVLLLLFIISILFVVIKNSCTTR